MEKADETSSKVTEPTTPPKVAKRSYRKRETKAAKKDLITTKKKSS